MAQNDTGNSNQYKPRFLLAILVLGVSVIGVGLLAAIILLRDDELDTSKYVLGAVLPLLGTWVGTILAYYFSRENFESASQSVRETFRQMTPMEKLASVSVGAKMIRRAKMHVLSATTAKPLTRLTIYGDILGTLSGKGRNRLPLLNESGYPQYIVHRSMIDQYLVGKSVEGGLDAKGLKKLTLSDLLSERPDLKKLFETSFAIVSEDATLADAKRAMDAIENCLDVFVTPRGTRSEPVVGWLTNVIITENAKV